MIVLWGIASGALPPLAQTLVLRLAGTEHRTLAGALIPVLFNGGIAIGAALAAGVVSRSGPDALPLPAAALVLLADTAGRLAFAPLQIPAGIVMTLAGVPLFLFLLWRRRDQI